MYRLHVHNQRSKLIKTDLGGQIFTYIYKLLRGKDILKTEFIEEELGVLSHQRVLWLMHQIKQYEEHPHLI